MSVEIEAMVKATIQAQIITALKSTPYALNELVKAALSKPVDEATGSFENRYGSKMVSYLDYIVGDTIRMAAHQAVREAVRERAEEIKQQVKVAITAEKTVEAMAEKIIGTMRDDWKMDITFRDGSRA